VPLEPAERSEPQETPSAPARDAAPSDEPAVAQTVDETPAYEAPIAAEPVLVATPIEPIAERAEPEEAVAAPTPEPTVAGDEGAQDQAAVEPFVLVAEDEPAADTEETQPIVALVTREQGEQLALPLSPVRPEVPREVFTSRTETSGRIDVEQPAPVEPYRPTIEPARSREPDEPASKAEIRSSLFTRLFQSIKRQSAEPAANRARWDEPKFVDIKPAQPVVTPSIEDQPSALQPQTPDAEITATKAKWLADFAATMPEAAAARTDDTPLQPIVMYDADGGSHTFTVRSRLRVMEALEVEASGRPLSPGYWFQVLGDHESDAWDLFRRLHVKMRREMTVRHIELTDLGWQIGQGQRIVGRIEWDPDTGGAVPLLVIDGKPFTWEQVGRMLMTFEGFTIDARIEDSIEIVDHSE
jgi:hypothetical protein